MDALKKIAHGIFYGIFDSLKGVAIIFCIDKEINLLNAQKEAAKREKLSYRMPLNAATTTIDTNKPSGELKIAKKVFKCCALNGGFTWLSIIIFDCVILPGLEFILTYSYGGKSDEVQFVWGWLRRLLSILFGMMWVLPIFLLSKLVSSLWFQDIANEAFRLKKGRSQTISSISKLIADFLFSLLVQALFLAQSMLLNLLPFNYIGSILCFIHLCMLYSLYSFEYKWFNMGWELHRRLSYIEYNWPYFIGFGMPLTILTSLPSSVIVSSCIFSIFFPVFILSGIDAQPVIGSSDFPLRLFSPVVAASNLFFNRSVCPKAINKTSASFSSSSKVDLYSQRQNRISRDSVSDCSSRSGSRTYQTSNYPTRQPR